MGIRYLGYEIVCNGCEKSAGKFASFEDAENHLPEGWAYWIPSFELECPECKAKRAERKE